MRCNFRANKITTGPNLKIGDKIYDIYNKLPGVVRLGTASGNAPLDSYIRWLISMGMHDTLNILTGLEVKYGR